VRVVVRRGRRRQLHGALAGKLSAPHVTADCRLRLGKADDAVSAEIKSAPRAADATRGYAQGQIAVTIREQVAWLARTSPNAKAPNKMDLHAFSALGEGRKRVSSAVLLGWAAIPALGRRSAGTRSSAQARLAEIACARSMDPNRSRPVEEAIVIFLEELLIVSSSPATHAEPNILILREKSGSGAMVHRHHHRIPALAPEKHAQKENPLLISFMATLKSAVAAIRAIEIGFDPRAAMSSTLRGCSEIQVKFIRASDAFVPPSEPQVIGHCTSGACHSVPKRCIG